MAKQAALFAVSHVQASHSSYSQLTVSRVPLLDIFLAGKR